MTTVLQDLHYALRMLLRRPGSTAVIVMTIAVGVGANTAIFSVIDAVVLRPLPFDDPEGLVMIKEMRRTSETGRGLVSYPNFEDWRRQNHVCG